MPSLSIDGLKQQIAARKLGAVYLFVGEDVQLMGRMVDAIEATIDEADRPFAIDRLYAGDDGGEPIDIVSAARVMPMLGDRRIVVVLRAERLLKPKRSAKAAESDEDNASTGDPDRQVDASPLEDYLAAPVTFTTLVFVASDVDRTRRLTKRVIEKALTTEFDVGERDSSRGSGQAYLDQVLRGTLAREGRSIEREAGVMLLERAAGDVSKLRDDLERLVLFTGDRRRITADDVMEVSSDTNAVSDEWAVVNAIAAGDAAGALVETGRRLDRGDSPHQLVGQLRWWVSAKLSVNAPNRVKPALDALLRTDLALKSSGGDDRVLVERLVVELTRP